MGRSFSLQVQEPSETGKPWVVLIHGLGMSHRSWVDPFGESLLGGAISFDYVLTDTNPQPRLSHFPTVGILGLFSPPAPFAPPASFVFGIFEKGRVWNSNLVPGKTEGPNRTCRRRAAGHFGGDSLRGEKGASRPQPRRIGCPKIPPGPQTRLGTHLGRRPARCPQPRKPDREIGGFF